MTLVTIFLGYVISISLLTYAAFAVDKGRAVRGDWRISEVNLLVLAVFGGWPGAKLAQKTFRHKTRKQPFARVLNTIPVMWAGLCVAMLSVASLDTISSNLRSVSSQIRLPKLIEPVQSERETPRFFVKARN